MEMMTDMYCPNLDMKSDKLIETLVKNSEVDVFELEPGAPPLFIVANSRKLQKPGALASWLCQNRSVVDALLLVHGGVVFREFSVSDTSEFNAVVKQFEPFSGNYQGGGAPRSKIEGQVYEATQLAGHLKIMLHQEMAYIEKPPQRIIFFCHKPAEMGGETVIADMRQITRGLPASLREKLERLGVLYVRNFGPPELGLNKRAEEHPDQRSWGAAFYSQDKDEVDKVCRAKGFDPVWLDNGGLRLRSRMPGFKAHRVTGEHIYRAVLHNDGGREMMTSALPEKKRRQVEKMLARQEFRTGCYLGDGSEITKDEMETLNSLFRNAERSWKWQPKDIMLLDNLLTAHGRNPFEGTRDIQVALLD